MQKLNASLLAGLAATAIYAVPAAWADDDARGEFRARLIGFDEVPAISSTGRGAWTASVHGDSVDWTLTYQDLEGTITTASHIHFGQKDVNGGVSVFFCGGGGRPPCTPKSGRFDGTFTAADVLGPTGQGIAPTEFAELIRAMRAGRTYVNVHTDKHPGGEIRGQVRRSEHDDD
jgi:hypothetical protein